MKKKAIPFKVGMAKAWHNLHLIFNVCVFLYY